MTVSIGNLPTGTPTSDDYIVFVDNSDSTTKKSQITSLPSSGDMTKTVYDPANISEQLVGLSSPQTLTNKRITKRVETVASSATPASNTDSYDVTKITSLATAITSLSSGLTGTPNDWDLHAWSITDNGIARAITCGASFEDGLLPLPTTTVISTPLDFLCRWNSATSKWRRIA